MEHFDTFKKQFKDKKITLMGLGLLGRGVGDTRFFAECGAKLTVTDLKTEEELKDSVSTLKSLKNIEYPITFVLSEHKVEDFTTADIVIKGNNVPLDNEYINAAQDAGVRVAMSVALFAKYVQELGAIVVGVTGTRGKTTVTNMVYEALRSDPALRVSTSHKVYLGGNVRGMSTLALASKVKKDDIVILELDSWLLQGFAYEQLSPHIAVFTNFYPDHLNYYKDMDEYFKDKATIFKYQKEELGDVLIVGGQVTNKINQEKVEAVMLPSDWELQVPGEHNRYNAGLAREVLQQLGMTDSEIKESLEQFTGVEGRLEYMGEFGSDNIKIYNDNNATTPEATIAGITALTGRQGSLSDVTDGEASNIVLIAGGTDKGTELAEVAKSIGQSCSEVHLLEGTGTERLMPLLPHATVHSTFKSTIESALKAAKSGDIVLFSPLFSSFGKEFVNEYDRNDQFKKVIKEYYAG